MLENKSSESVFVFFLRQQKNVSVCGGGITDNVRNANRLLVFIWSDSGSYLLRPLTTNLVLWIDQSQPGPNSESQSKWRQSKNSSNLFSVNRKPNVDDNNLFKRM